VPDPIRFTLQVNGADREVTADPDMPLLWVLRDLLGLTGTKYGCGMMVCGACTVHLDGEAVRSCRLPVGSIAGRQVTTIEGLAGRDGQAGGHPVQRAWVAEQVPQCGYCQSGQIMSAVALLARTPSPNDEQINAAMDGNLCRCGTYLRIRRAIHRAALASADSPPAGRGGGGKGGG
jgi:isoquinoline 1-oxidoreductase alpha subunit